LVVKGGDTGVEPNPERECPDEDSGDEYAYLKSETAGRQLKKRTVAPEDRIVEDCRELEAQSSEEVTEIQKSKITAMVVRKRTVFGHVAFFSEPPCSRFAARR
jgi:hypothetical protein